jgi:hypothetical protein
MGIEVSSLSETIVYVGSYFKFPKTMFPEIKSNRSM